MTSPEQHPWESLVIGQEAQLERRVSQEDIAAFARLSGDENPLHVVQGVAHGMYLGALVSALIGMQLPGESALLVKESLEFKKSVRAGDTVVVHGTLIHKSEATKIITVSIRIEVGGETRAQGEILVQVR